LYIVNPSTVSLRLLETFLKDTVNGALGHTVHRFYQGVLYFPNVTQFNGTRENVIYFTTIRKVGANLHESHTRSTVLCANIVYRISTKSDNKCGQY